MRFFFVFWRKGQFSLGCSIGAISGSLRMKHIFFCNQRKTAQEPLVSVKIAQGLIKAMREDFKILIIIPGMPAETTWKLRNTAAHICVEMTYAWFHNHKDCAYPRTLVHNILMLNLFSKIFALLIRHLNLHPGFYKAAL